jgi:hypothetical protein
MLTPKIKNSATRSNPVDFSIHTQDSYVPSSQAVAHPANRIHCLREKLLLFHAGVDLLVNDDR